MLKHNLTAEELVEHYRDVCAVLTNAGCLPKRRAAMVFKSVQTLKQYAVMPPSTQHRAVPVADLQKLRLEAIKLHWDFADRAEGAWITAEGTIGTNGIARKRYMPMVKGLSRGTTTFLPRAVELAELGGGIIEGLPLDEARSTIGTARFLQRSRWRRASYALSAAGKGDIVRETARAHGYSDHVIDMIGSEYAPWRVSVAPALLEAVETIAQEIA